jgi:hypothetical protein
LSIVYQSLKDRRGIGESIRHDLILIISAGCVEGCLPLTPLTYPNQVVGISKVQLGKNGVLLERFKSRGEEW